jgi:hypothetical protein
MIHGSRASGAASPLSWISAAGYPVWRSELAIHAPVNAAGPAIPAAAPARAPASSMFSTLAHGSEPVAWRFGQGFVTGGVIRS